METSVCVLITLLLSGASSGGGNPALVYSSVGGQAVLPCRGWSSASCSALSWTFYRGGDVRFTEEVSDGQVSAASDRAERTAVLPDCSLHLRRLRAEDAGSYVCLERRAAVADVYLSLLGVASPSGVLELRPGGTLVLSCVLFTYFDAGSCTLYASRKFRLSWRAEDGSELRQDHRLALLEDGLCNVTLVARLQAQDHRRRFRCQVNTSEGAQNLDFRSTFWSEPDRGPSEVQECLAPPPVSRVALCVALPLMVLAVGLFTWRLDHKRNRNRNRARAAGASCKLQEIR